MPGATVKDCLADIGVSAPALASCYGLNAEWSLIKKNYFKKILVSHPDKGGDASVFRAVQASFEVLRKLFEDGEVKSFATSLDQSTGDEYRGAKDDFKGSSTPSWEYYAEAAKEAYATYRVEVARSNRSRCQKSKLIIDKGQLRVGFMLESGGYGLWTHLDHWRVPSKIWLGLPDPKKHRDLKRFEKALLQMNEVSLCGMSDLPAADQKKVAKYVMDKTHWSFGGAVDKVKKKPAAAAATESPASSSKSDSQSIVLAAKQKETFVMPVPGKGAPKDSLAGRIFVITGTFPEVGGGKGFEIGKDKVKAMIKSFGGKVASGVTGKTDVLVVGKNPGFSKVSKARKQAKTRLLGLQDLKVGLQRGSLGDGKGRTMKIESFATGFGMRRGGPNGKAAKASKAQLAVASGAKTAKKRSAAAVGPAAKVRRLR